MCVCVCVWWNNNNDVGDMKSFLLIRRRRTSRLHDYVSVVLSEKESEIYQAKMQGISFPYQTVLRPQTKGLRGIIAYELNKS